MKKNILLFVLFITTLMATACGGSTPAATQAPAQPATTEAPAQPVAIESPASSGTATTVEVTLTDNKIESSLTSFQVGVPYTFVITNAGRHGHNFNISTPVSVVGSLQDALKTAPLAGFDNVFECQYETDLLSSQSYLWSYGAGGGNYTGAGGIGNSGNFVTNPYKTVFTQLFGSYFGDWDSQDNFMRSSLASPGSILACVWGGRPHWYLHHMGAGLPIGYSTLLTMNNRGIYTNTGYGNAQVDIALMGDPSLRSSYTKPPQAFFAQANQNKINLNWTRAAKRI